MNIPCALARVVVPVLCQTRSPALAPFTPNFTPLFPLRRTTA